MNREQRQHWAHDGTMYGGGAHVDQQGKLGPYKPERLLAKRKRKHVSLGILGAVHAVLLSTLTSHEALPRSL